MDLLRVALAAAGFALLVRASPAGRLPFKPFSCSTCLSGWGAIGAGWIQALSAASLEGALCAWLLAALAGTAGSVLLLSVIDAIQAYAVRGTPIPAFDAEEPPPPPVLT